MSYQKNNCKDLKEQLLTMFVSDHFKTRAQVRIVSEMCNDVLRIHLLNALTFKRFISYWGDS